MRFRLRPLACAALGTALLPAPPVAAQAGLAAGGDTLRTAPSAASAPAPAPPVTATIVAAAGEDGFGLRSTDGTFAIRFQGGAHIDGRFYPEHQRDGAVEEFDLRRLRTDLRGTVFRDYDFRLNLDYAGNRVEVLDANLDARFSPALQLRVGKFKAPVGLERLQNIFATTFAELAFPTALVPNRDIGAQLSGSVGGEVAGYAIGVFNGVADGASGDHDLSDSKDLAGRVFFRPFSRGSLAAVRGLGFGVGGTIGTQRATPATPGLAAPRTPLGRGLFLRYRGDGTAPGTALADGRRTRISPQASWYLGSLGLLGEYVRTETDVRLEAEAATLAQSAWQIAGSWVLTGERTSYRGVVPARPFDPQLRQWGAWEVALRFQGLRGDADAFPLYANPALSALSASGFTVGVNWYLNRVVRFLANYEHTRFESAPAGVAMPSEGVLVSRFQLAF
jgi:phosphate-selective porin OprO/OprP